MADRVTLLLSIAAAGAALLLSFSPIAVVAAPASIEAVTLSAHADVAPLRTDDRFLGVGDESFSYLRNTKTFNDPNFQSLVKHLSPGFLRVGAPPLFNGKIEKQQTHTISQDTVSQDTQKQTDRQADKVDDRQTDGQRRDKREKTRRSESKRSSLLPLSLHMHSLYLFICTPLLFWQPSRDLGVVVDSFGLLGCCLLICSGWARVTFYRSVSVLVVQL